MSRNTRQPQLAVMAEPVIEVALQSTVRAMLKARCEEHAHLATLMKEHKARQERIRVEVQELFVKAEQGQALLDGTTIHGYRVKMVFGSTKRLDKLALMKAYGLSHADLDAVTTDTPNEPYVKITAPGPGEERE